VQKSTQYQKLGAPRWTILVNARAGALRPFRAGPGRVRAEAARLGLDAEVLPAGSSKEMREAVRRLVAADPDARVAVAGGDGTVGLAAQEVVHTGATLGILPMGTFNNFAAALELPTRLADALTVLRDGRAVDVSLGSAQAGPGTTRYFAEAAGVGLFADSLAFYGSGPPKNPLRTLYSLMRLTFPEVRTPALRLTLFEEPGGPEVRHEFPAVAMCTVANTHRTGAAIHVAPNAELEDAVLDILVIEGLKRRELLGYFRALRSHRWERLPKARLLRAHGVRIESALPQHLHCDDRILGAFTEATLSLEPAALRVQVPALNPLAPSFASE